MTHRVLLVTLLLLLLFVSPVVTFIVVRHLAIIRNRGAHPLELSSGLQVTSRKSRAGTHPVPYFFIVLGSGGHTKEMLAMMEPGLGDLGAMHRRYVVSSGDSMSLEQLHAFEDEIRSPGGSPEEMDATRADEDKCEHEMRGLLAAGGEAEFGSWDVHIVRRARRVHQPLWSTPASAMVSFLQLIALMLKPPNTGAKAPDMSDIPDVPDVVVTNGPATGFFAALAAHVLKMFYLVPQGKLRVLYVESWARIRTLSLTGRLVFNIGIADVFVVQHEPVAKKYGVVNAGWLVVGRKKAATKTP